MSTVHAAASTGPVDLPPALRSWSAALAALTPAVMTALMPSIHRLDELFSRHGDVESATGEPAGLAGLSTRGTPARLLVSEWLLAEELPEEFLRRAVSRELLHLDTAYRQVPPAGTTRIVVDVGPAQAGAARLVQLAALVVLHRRAQARGAPLELGILGEPVDKWHTGDLPELLRTWLTARSRQEPTPAEVEARSALCDRAWFLLAPQLAARLHDGTVPRRRVLTSEEAEWDHSGVVAARVALAGERVHLPLPAHPVGLRVLRGEGFRRASSSDAGRTGAGAPVLRSARFSGTAATLVGRGTADDVIVTATVGSEAEPGQVRPHTFHGTVIAASATGPRLIVVHQHGYVTEVSVIGRRLGSWHGCTFPRELLGLSADDLAEIAGGPPLPVHHSGGSLWLRLPAGWVRIEPSGDVVPMPLVTLATPIGPDTLTLAGSHLPAAGNAMWTTHGEIYPGVGVSAVVAGAGWVGARTGADEWTVVGPGRQRHDLPVPDGSHPVGLVLITGRPYLVVQSTGGLLVRLVGPTGTSTLTSLSGAAQRLSVHESVPLLARDVGDGRVQVHDLQAGTRRGGFAGGLA